MLVRLSCSGCARSIGEGKHGAKIYKKQRDLKKVMSYATPWCFHSLEKRDERLADGSCISVECLFS